jgi:rod shape-determining protein MreC
MRNRFLKNKKVISMILIIVVFLLYNFTGFSRFFSVFRYPISYVGAKFYNAGNSINNFWSGLLIGKNLNSQLNKCYANLAKSESEFIKLSFLEKENKELKDLIRFNEQKEMNLVVGKILYHNNEIGINSITVNIGSEDGVEPGFPAIAGEGILIGKVKSVSKNTSNILLVYDMESTIAVSLASNTDVQAIAMGNLGISLFMDLIPQDVEIEEGEIVLSSSLEKFTPSGLLVGRVSEVIYREGELFKSALLEPIIPIFNLSTVGIIVN